MKQSERPTQYSLFMTTALLFSQRSECRRSSIYANSGAIIVSTDSRSIIGFGYNGRERDATDCPGDKEGDGNCGCVHAEINAIVNCHSNKQGALMVCTTMPCAMCARAIVNAGIIGVHFFRAYRNDEGFKILRRSGLWTFPVSKQSISQNLRNSLDNLEDDSGLSTLKQRDLSFGVETTLTPSK